jgi:hypothetical protein
MPESSLLQSNCQNKARFTAGLEENIMLQMLATGCLLFGGIMAVLWVLGMVFVSSCELIQDIYGAGGRVLTCLANTINEWLRPGGPSGKC